MQGKSDSEPKYQDTDESKAQLEKIRVIEAQMKEVQLKLVKKKEKKMCFVICLRSRDVFREH